LRAERRLHAFSIFGEEHSGVSALDAVVSVGPCLTASASERDLRNDFNIQLYRSNGSNLDVTAEFID
jgi:hypothetical protein